MKSETFNMRLETVFETETNIKIIEKLLLYFITLKVKVCQVSRRINKV